MTIGFVSGPAAAMNPPNVRMTSDGIGGNTISARMSRNTPAYPNSAITPVIQFSIRFLRFS